LTRLDRPIALTFFKLRGNKMNMLIVSKHKDELTLAENDWSNLA
jgi:hypothetical protein